MVTENVYFNWKFSEEEEYYTNSPVVEKVFNEPGDFIIILNATNPGKFYQVRLMMMWVLQPLQQLL